MAFEREYFETVYKLADEIHKISGLDIEVRVTKTGQLGIWANKKNFAFASPRVREREAAIDMNRDWASSSGVDQPASKNTENGWYAKPGSVWYVELGNDARIREVANILWRVAEARLAA